VTHEVGSQPKAATGNPVPSPSVRAAHTYTARRGVLVPPKTQPSSLTSGGSGEEAGFKRVIEGC